MGAKASLSLYSFSEMWHPSLVVVLVAMAFLYFLLVGRWRGYFHGSESVPTRKKNYFMIGLLFYYAVEGTPFKVLGDYLFSIHMITMSVAYLVVPPFILLGIPHWFWEPILHQKVLKKIIAFFTRPMIALVLFNMLFSIFHFPIIFNTAMEDPFYMVGSHLILLIFAFFMWWPMITPYPELNELSDLKKVFYMFAAGMLISPACALLFLSGHPMYEPYDHVPQLFYFMGSLEDQRASGVFMKAIQEITYGTAIVITLYRWATKEKGKKDVDAFSTSAMSRTLRPFRPQEGEK